MQLVDLTFTLVVMLAVVIVLVIAFINWLSVFRPWQRAFLNQAEVSVFDIVGMRSRRIDVNEVVDNRIVSVQAGTPISIAEFERAASAGCNLRKLTLAYIASQKTDNPISFDELVDAELKDHLAKMLNE